MKKVEVKLGVLKGNFQANLNVKLSDLQPRIFHVFSKPLTSVFIYGDNQATGLNCRDYHGNFIINNGR